MNSQRFYFIDGMRGLAALAVTLFHIGRDFLGIPLLHYGSYGVIVFFVISGFVITHSFAHKAVSGRYIWVFMLRRSVRLDPTYWFAIALALLALWLPAMLLGYAVDLPSWGEVGLHAIYLQGLTGVTPINVVFWTLCYEIQFYLVLCVLFYLVEKVYVRVSQWFSRDVTKLLLLSPLLMISLLWPLGLTHYVFVGETKGGLFIDLWYLFLLGVFAYWAINSSAARWVLAAAVTLLVLHVSRQSTWSGYEVVILVGVLSALLFTVSGMAGKLGVWLRAKWLQYLGLISYSLYLSHDIVGISVRDTGLHLAKKHLQLEASWFQVSWVLFSLIVCGVFAAALHRYIERPTLRFSRKIV